MGGFRRGRADGDHPPGERPARNGRSGDLSHPGPGARNPWDWPSGPAEDPRHGNSPAVDLRYRRQRSRSGRSRAPQGRPGHPYRSSCAAAKPPGCRRAGEPAPAARNPPPRRAARRRGCLQAGRSPVRPLGPAGRRRSAPGPGRPGDRRRCGPDPCGQPLPAPAGAEGSAGDTQAGAEADVRAGKPGPGAAERGTHRLCHRPAVERHRAPGGFQSGRRIPDHERPGSRADPGPAAGKPEHAAPAAFRPGLPGSPGPDRARSRRPGASGPDPFAPNLAGGRGRDRRQPPGRALPAPRHPDRHPARPARSRFGPVGRRHRYHRCDCRAI